MIFVSKPKKDELPSFTIRKPNLNDGEPLYFLAASCPPLETNSIYSYLLVSSHFDQTSAVCECKGDLVGFTSGYRHPHQDDTLFIWQVAVKDHMRGRGIAKEMLLDILGREELGDIRYLEATVTPDNLLSKSLFTGIADTLGAPVREESYFSQEVFHKSLHQEEFIIQIGPFNLQK